MREFFEEGYGAPAGFVPAEELRLRGPKGKDGTDGQAATVAVGTVTTGAAGSSASVVNRGTASAAVLDFTIPKGDKGSDGTDTDPAAVHYSADTGKTEAEKAQARSNIGAGTYTKPLGGIPDSDLAAAHYTESEADDLLAAKSDKHTTVKNTTSTSITVAAQKNTDYIYGELSDLTITWGTGEDNAEINITFKSGSTPTTLSVSTTGATFESFIPSTNAEVEINAKWYIDKWLVAFKEVFNDKYTLLFEETESGTHTYADGAVILTAAVIAPYKKLLLECMWDTIAQSSRTHGTGIIDLTYPAGVHKSCTVHTNNNATWQGRRDYFIDSTGNLACSAGTRVYPNVIGQIDTICVPYKIYGIK